jgi:hypothetical protein
MFQIFRSFFSEAGISGGLLVTVDATGYIIPCPATGNTIGTVEAAGGNIDSQFDVSTNAALPVNVRLFGPTRNVAMTGVATTGFSAGSLIYLAAAGYGSNTGTVVMGMALATYPNGIGNGGWIEVAEIQ